MKKIVLFLPIVVLLFLFQPTFNAEAFSGIVPNMTDPGGGGGGGGGSGDSIENAIPINIGNIGTTFNKYDFLSEARSEVYYKFTAPGTGDYYFNITPDNSLSMYAELDTSSQNLASSNNWSDNKTITFDIELSSGQTYYLDVVNSSVFSSGYFTSSIFRADVNTKEHPQSIYAGVAKSSLIDYIGDADYYTFTNYDGGFYDFYSTGYNTTIDSMADLYLCNDSSCKTYQSTALVTNDDYDKASASEKIYYSDMGAGDFGFKYNFGFNNYGQTYLIKIYHWNNSSTGYYSIHMDKHHESDLPISTEIDKGIKAVVWESEINPGGYSYVDGYNPLPTNLNDISNGESFLAKQIFLINPSPDLKLELENNINGVIGKLEADMAYNTMVGSVTVIGTGLTIGLVTFTGLAVDEITYTVMGTFLGKEISVVGITYALNKAINSDLNATRDILVGYREELKNTKIFCYKQIVECEIKDVETEHGTLKTWIFHKKFYDQSYSIYNANLVPNFYAKEEITFLNDTNYSIKETKYQGIFTEYTDINVISDIVNDILGG